MKVKANFPLNVKEEYERGNKVCACISVQNRKILSSLVKNQFLPTCIQIINTNGDAIYVFLWMEEDRQFLWNWFSDKFL